MGVSLTSFTLFTSASAEISKPTKSGEQFIAMAAIRGVFCELFGFAQLTSAPNAICFERHLYYSQLRHHKDAHPRTKFVLSVFDWVKALYYRYL